MVHIAPHHHRRQLQDDPLTAPTAAGLTGAVTVSTNVPDPTGTLAFDGSVAGGDGSPTTAPPLAVSSVPVLTSSADLETASPEPNSSTAKAVIPISTVVGACLGALAGAVLLILIGIWFYKRSELKRRTRQPNSPLSANRNVQGDIARSRSRMENWNKLGDMDDKWETKYQTKEVLSPSETVGPMEKLTMFKSPSIRTAYTHRSEEHPTFDLEPHPFAAYHPGLAKDMASATAEPVQPPAATARQFLGRVDVGPAISWDSQGSFLSLQSRMSASMSPTPGFAIPTPHITSSEPHVWESAEVLDFGEVADTYSNNPFLEASERRKSGNNPFFNAQASTTSLHKSLVPAIITPSKDKGKARDLTGSSADPFNDENSSPGGLHAGVVSVSSVSSNDRAMQSLIAALDITPEDVHERLRVASMQPSIMSNASAYTSGGEEDVTQAFPLPPGPYYSKP